MARRTKATSDNQRLSNPATKQRHQSRSTSPTATARNSPQPSRSTKTNPLGLGHGADRLSEIPAAFKPRSAVGGIRRKPHSSPFVAQLPEVQKPFSPPSLQEQFRRALPVLLEARERFKQGMPLIDALRPTGSILDVYARRVCQAAIWNFEAIVAAEMALIFGARVRLFRSDVLRALDRAIRMARGKKHGGGWRVSR